MSSNSLASSFDSQSTQKQKFHIHFYIKVTKHSLSIAKGTAEIVLLNKTTITDISQTYLIQALRPS